jgi:hypothetical protein
MLMACGLPANTHNLRITLADMSVALKNAIGYKKTKEPREKAWLFCFLIQTQIIKS